MRREGSLVHLWVVLGGLAAALFFCAVAPAAENPRVKKEMEAITAVIEANFHASNAEDVAGVMKTMTPYTPNKELFVEELKRFFAEVDVYTRLISVDLVSAEMTEYGPTATVKVVQHTIQPQNAEDVPYSEFRTRSAMLPPWEVCEFELVLHKVRGKWLAHLMGGNVREVPLPEDQETVAALQTVTGQQQNCPDGSCNLTNRR